MARTRHVGVLLVVAALLLWGAAAAGTASLASSGGAVDSASTAQVQQQEAPENASVTFEDQAVENGTVTVQNVTVPEGGYVAVHNDSLRDGRTVDSVVGVSDYLEPGTHENVTVTLYEGVEGAEFADDAAPNGTETLIAMPHVETSEEMADNETTTTTTTDGGVGGNDTTTTTADNTTTTEANVTTTDDGTNATTTDDGGLNDTTTTETTDTTTDDGTNATTTDGGVGTTTESGTDTTTDGGVETTTDSGVGTTTEGADITTGDETTAAEGNDTTAANAQQQTQTNQTYDFVASDGAEDGPYTVDGAVVTDSAEVEFSAPETDEGDEGAGGADQNDTETNDTETQAGSSFVVESIEAPALAAPNATITVNATISNSADEEVTEDVAFRLAGGEADVVVHQDVSVDAGANETVTFELNAADVGEGEYIHGVTTENSSKFATIAVTNDSMVMLGDQMGDGENVTVESVYVPEGGYVAIHNDSLLDGDAVGSVVGVSDYLEPGVHENVSVALYEGVEGAEFSTDASSEDNATLIAMPHVETTDDETYDFVQSEGEDDGPYTVDGEVVADVGNLTITAEDAPSGSDEDATDN